MKKAGKITLITLAAIVVALVAVVAALWGKEIATISTVHQVGSNKYLYQMEYKADYDLQGLVEADIDSNDKLLKYVLARVGKGIIKIKSKAPNGDVACTSFLAKDADGEGYFYGRNYDFFKNPILVTTSHPKNGYASIAVTDLAHLGYSLEKVPDSFMNKVLCIASIYAPVDGMNEKGLCTSIMALPNQPSRQNTGKHVAGTTIIMRLLLDNCATVDEALALVQSVDVRHDDSGTSGYHYMVGDANGDCAVFEFDKWDGWKTVIIRKDEASNYMHVTNHLLNPKYYTTEPNPEYGNPNSHSWWRYAAVKEYMDERNGIVSLAEAQECLAIVHWKDLVWPNGLIEDTVYSNIYDCSRGTLSMRPWNDYETTYTFELR